MKSKKAQVKTQGLSFSAKLIMILLLISLVPMAVVGYLSLNSASGGLEEAAFKQLQSVRNNKSNQIRDFFRERLAWLVYIIKL